MGWAGITNGRLLSVAEGSFDVFVTGDRNLSFQQNLTRFTLAVVVLKGQSIRLVDTKPLMPKLLALLAAISPGSISIVEP